MTAEIKSIERSITNDRLMLQGCNDDYRAELVHRIRKQSAFLKKLKEKLK